MAHLRLAGWAVEAPGHLDARLDSAGCHFPTQLRRQPAHQHPRLHDRMRAMFNADLAALSTSPLSSAPSSACVNIARQYLRRRQLTSEATPTAGTAALDLFQPGGGTGHTAGSGQPMLS